MASIHLVNHGLQGHAYGFLKSRVLGVGEAKKTGDETKSSLFGDILNQVEAFLLTGQHKACYAANQETRWTSLMSA
jgi:hypothetical protein